MCVSDNDSTVGTLLTDRLLGKSGPVLHCLLITGSCILWMTGNATDRLEENYDHEN